jgi:cysteine-rich repeat protein
MPVRGEDCDDGNALSGDGCSSTCTTEAQPTCVDAGASCAGDMCGDGIVQAAEACDDGNRIGGDGCTASCKLEIGFTCQAGRACEAVCGDGVRVQGEECDEGADNGRVYAMGGCSLSCTKLHHCGDGIVDTDNGEDCDFGALNGSPSSPCDASCQAISH